jgi:hypothetical protein
MLAMVLLWLLGRDTMSVLSHAGDEATDGHANVIFG